MWAKCLSNNTTFSQFSTGDTVPLKCLWFKLTIFIASVFSIFSKKEKSFHPFLHICRFTIQRLELFVVCRPSIGCFSELQFSFTDSLRNKFPKSCNKHSLLQVKTLLFFKVIHGCSLSEWVKAAPPLRPERGGGGVRREGLKVWTPVP